MERYEDWEQYCWFELTIKNTGKKVIEDYKIELEFEGEFEKVGTEKPDVFNYKIFKSNVKSYSNCNRSLYIDPYEPVLVPSDGFTTSGLYIKPTIAIETEVMIKWKLLSRDFEDCGELVVSVMPKYNIQVNSKFVDDENLVGDTVDVELIRRPREMGILGGFSDDISDMKFE